MDAIVQFVVAAAAQPASYLVVALLVAADGVIPVVPSEATVVALAAAVSSEHPRLLPLLVLAAAGGAWVGDNLAFTIGAIPRLRRSRILTSGRMAPLMDWARTGFEQRGATIIIIARFLPIVRIAVNITAGTVGLRRRRFMALTGLTSLIWAGYTIATGAVAGAWFAEHPIAAMAGAALAGAVLGTVIDRAVRAFALARSLPQLDDAPAAPAPGPRRGSARRRRGR